MSQRAFVLTNSQIGFPEEGTGGTPSVEKQQTFNSFTVGPEADPGPTFTLSQPPTDDSPQFFLNGVEYEEDVDWERGPDPDQVTWLDNIFELTTGDSIQVYYFVEAV